MHSSGDNARNHVAQYPCLVGVQTIREGMNTMRTNRHRSLILLLSFVLFGALPLSAVQANTVSDIRSTQGLRKHVTLVGIREHQAALQQIADAHGGNRLAGTSGYDASAQYVYDMAAAAGYNVTFQEFEFLLVSDLTAPVLTQISPTPTDYVDGPDFQTMSYSGSGDSTAAVTAVDLVVPSPEPNASTSGCEASDFVGFAAGSIALLQRGTCTFRQKAENAQAAGAVGVIIFNEGNPGRTAVISGTLGPPPMSISVVGTTFEIGDELRNGVLNGPTGVTVRLRTDTIAELRLTRNVIAETPGGDPNNVIVIGAHLDSVSRGPGINDNGSGSAAILEIAEVFAQQERTPRNKLRFIWWGAEELGLIGSNYYIANLSQEERDKIRLNLNFDMVGSPNFVRFVYDGDNSAFPVSPGIQEGPSGSGSIEQLFLDYFQAMGLPVEPTPFNGRSDYGPFITVGIPAGGLFTGAEGVKTAEQAAIYGGTAGQQYDPCYHLACDTYANNNDTGLDQMSDAIAHAVLLYSKRNFTKQPLVDPEPAAVSGMGGGGGLHDDHDHDRADH
jgi:Zn-dependent M28 family amino/carboxypeptidase